MASFCNVLLTFLVLHGMSISIISVQISSSTVILYGMLPQLPEASLFQVCAVDSAVDTAAASQLLEIQGLLEEFSSLVAVPAGLPLPHDCDHAIPLIPGTSPVFI
ncbi:hypothetical protein U9M48_026873 [Paspalum notatum var. saurae]|uniref:Uncharacterized protein n=1 Tax=Paspalum notatum var. saurae TaxID=547442 RepID=A0AAQ3WYQ7_PASNO